MSILSNRNSMVSTLSASFKSHSSSKDEDTSASCGLEASSKYLLPEFDQVAAFQIRNNECSSCQSPSPSHSGPPPASPCPEPKKTVHLTCPPVSPTFERLYKNEKRKESLWREPKSPLRKSSAIILRKSPKSQRVTTRERKQTLQAPLSPVFDRLYRSQKRSETLLWTDPPRREGSDRLKVIQKQAAGGSVPVRSLSPKRTTSATAPLLGDRSPSDAAWDRLHRNEKRQKALWKDPKESIGIAPRSSRSLSPKRRSRTESMVPAIFDRLCNNEKRPESVWHAPTRTFLTKVTRSSVSNPGAKELSSQRSGKATDAYAASPIKDKGNFQTRRMSRSMSPKRTVNSATICPPSFSKMPLPTTISATGSISIAQDNYERSCNDSTRRVASRSLTPQKAHTVASPISLAPTPSLSCCETGPAKARIGHILPRSKLEKMKMERGVSEGAGLNDVASPILPKNGAVDKSARIWKSVHIVYPTQGNVRVAAVIVDNYQQRNIPALGRAVDIARASHYYDTTSPDDLCANNYSQYDTCDWWKQANESFPCYTNPCQKGSLLHASFLCPKPVLSACFGWLFLVPCQTPAITAAPTKQPNIVQPLPAGALLLFSC